MKNKRNTWLKRAAAFVLCAALVLVTGVFPTRVQAKSLDDLKKDYNELEKEIEANQKKLENIKNQQASNAEKMKLLSSQAEAISSQLDVLNFLKSGGYRTVIALTKIDKLNKTERAQRLEAFKTELADFPDYETVPFSSQTGEGVDTLRKIIAAAAE